MMSPLQGKCFKTRPGHINTTCLFSGPSYHPNSLLPRIARPVSRFVLTVICRLNARVHKSRILRKRSARMDLSQMVQKPVLALETFRIGLPRETEWTRQGTLLGNAPERSIGHCSCRTKMVRKCSEVQTEVD